MHAKRMTLVHNPSVERLRLFILSPCHKKCGFHVIFRQNIKNLGCSVRRPVIKGKVYIMYIIRPRLVGRPLHSGHQHCLRFCSLRLTIRLCPGLRSRQNALPQLRVGVQVLPRIAHPAFGKHKVVQLPLQCHGPDKQKNNQQHGQHNPAGHNRDNRTLHFSDPFSPSALIAEYFCIFVLHVEPPR